MTDIEFVDHSKVRLFKHDASDIDVAMAAWVSNFSTNGEPTTPEGMGRYYDLRDKWRHHPNRDKDTKRVAGLINFLYRERHLSPFEHGSFTFIIDTPIFVAREFMRHRTFSYNEASGRYKELEPRFYLINSERPVIQQGKVGSYTFDAGTDEQYGHTFASTTHAYTTAWKCYQEMLSNGVAREVARNVLPVGTMTQFYATCNPRNLMQFLLLRDDDNALYEIREVAKQMSDILEEKMPLTFKAFKRYDWRDERKELEHLRAKVAQDEAYETYRENLEHRPKYHLDKSSIVYPNELRKRFL